MIFEERIKEPQMRACLTATDQLFTRVIAATDGSTELEQQAERIMSTA